MTIDDVYAKLTNSGATVIAMMPNLENVIMDYADIFGRRITKRSMVMHLAPQV